MTIIQHQGKAYQFEKISQKFSREGDNCYLYGAGLWGRICATLMAEAFPEKKLTFVDKNAPSLGEVLGHPVLTPEEFLQRSPSAPLVLALWTGREEVVHWYMAEGRGLAQLFCFSAYDPEKTGYGGENQLCNLLSWREYSLGFYHPSNQKYATEEMFPELPAPAPTVQHLNLGENQLFSLETHKPLSHQPKLSVIIPVYQVVDYLDRCLTSVVGQTYKNLEILLIDNGGTDACPEICDRWAKKDPRIRAIHKEHGLVSTARNRGLSEATGDLITFCDSDDYLHPQAYALAVSTLLSLDCDLVEYHFTRTPGEEDSPKITQGVAYVETTQEAILGMLAGQNHCSVVWNKVYRSAVLSGLNCREDRILDDEFFLTQYFGRCKTVATLPVSLYYYYQRPSSYMNRSYDLTRTQGLEAAVERYFLLGERFPALKASLFRHCYHLFDLLLQNYVNSDLEQEARETLLALLEPLEEEKKKKPRVR